MNISTRTHSKSFLKANAPSLYLTKINVMKNWIKIILILGIIGVIAAGLGFQFIYNKITKPIKLIKVYK